MRLAILLPQKGRRRPEHPQTASQTTSTRIFERPDGPLTAPSSVEVPPTTAHFNLPVDLGLVLDIVHTGLPWGLVTARCQTSAPQAAPGR